MTETKPPAASDGPRPNLIGRALGATWRVIAGREPEAVAAAGAAEARRLKARMVECLSGPGGEVSARARTAALGQDYLRLPEDGRRLFLTVLAEEFGPPPGPIAEAAAAFAAAAPGEARDAAIAALRRALASPRATLLTRFTALPDGVKFLVDLRATLLSLAAEDRRLAPLLDDLTGLLRAWFDVGFLELERIDWRSSAAVLEKLIAYEAVHEIAGWDDLKKRLESDRRCFAFFHPRMRDEPLIFVEVALTDGIATSIQALLDPKAPVLDPAAADTAIFYSISNAQAGLAGISFGNFLIKQVVARLKAEFPRLARFATLSPMPGFVKWLATLPEAEALTPAERRALPKRAGGNQHPLALTRNPAWYKNDYLARALERPLTRLAARYLAVEKRADGAALDPVAHFHLTNGARIERIDWLADLSPKGLAQSAGLMVNYLYRLDELDANHEAYVSGEAVPAAAAIRSLAKG